MKILVVDDSMVYRKTIVNYLKAEMTDVDYITAQNGQEGFELYQEEDPDYIFLDLLMPELNGEEVLKKIREEDQETKVIILTADVQKMVKEDLEKLSIFEFINKPFSPDKAEEIADKIRTDYNA
ncbi:MAG: response regulator [Halanaerobacter sp.]